MFIHTISGSARPTSSNVQFLEALAASITTHELVHLSIPEELPLFRAGLDQYPWPPAVVAWRAAVAQADALIIATPEYLHNLPALLKNALEWLTSSGELAGKAVLPITLTPHPPRGEKAMQSLTWSLQALNARIVTQLPLYQKDILGLEKGIIEDGEALDILKMAIDLL